jgi:hypothetical protein
MGKRRKKLSAWDTPRWRQSWTRSFRGQWITISNFEIDREIEKGILPAEKIEARYREEFSSLLYRYDLAEDRAAELERHRGAWRKEGREKYTLHTIRMNLWSMLLKNNERSESDAALVSLFRAFACGQKLSDWLAAHRGLSEKSVRNTLDLIRSCLAAPEPGKLTWDIWDGHDSWE